jgi:hypothetical protein
VGLIEKERQTRKVQTEKLVWPQTVIPVAVTGPQLSIRIFDFSSVQQFAFRGFKMTRLRVFNSA